MFARSTKIVLTLAALATMGMTPSAAEAGHKCYKYTGTCYHYGGEAEMIRALEILELTYWEQDDFVRRDLIDLAHLELQKARFAVSSGTARHYLQLADRYLFYFESTCNTLYLDRAAAYIHHALKHETRICSLDLHGGHPGLHGGHPVQFGGGHPLQHSGHSFGRSRVNFSQGGIHIGGKRGGFTIKW
ncbi:MAG: hypothetical protein MPJ50_13405 [Pirellulales bacterium]|nr:hypothetical protein [Pirellulales bacterium]